MTEIIEAPAANGVVAPAKRTRASTAKKSVETPPAEATQITIRRLGTERILVPILGTAPLIVHAWSPKQKRAMLDAMQGVKRPKEHKNPEAEFESAMYRCMDGRYGVPSLAFKSAFVAASRYFGKSVPMTVLRQALFVAGVPSDDTTSTTLLTPIETVSPPRMREDPVRVGAGGTDLRYRPEFTQWSAVIDLTYVSSMIDRDSVLSLMEAAGMGVGVCEWRPERDGANGTFCLDESREIAVVPWSRSV